MALEMSGFPLVFIRVCGVREPRSGVIYDIRNVSVSMFYFSGSLVFITVYGVRYPNSDIIEEL